MLMDPTARLNEKDGVVEEDEGRNRKQRER
jgi:hypothetical protein